MYNIYNKYKSIIIITIKLLIIIGAFYFISQKVVQNRTLFSSQFSDYFYTNILQDPFNLILLISLSLLNWFVEIIKWKNLVSYISNISFVNSAKQSLASLTASLITPNRIGEYGAKAIYYPGKERKNILALNLLGNTAQMCSTVIFGTIGLSYLSHSIEFPFNYSINSFYIFSIALIIIIGFFFFKKTILTNWFVKLKNYFQNIPADIHIKNIFLSILKYLIFSHQFYFLLILFEVDLDYFTAMSLISSTYFVASIIPSFVIFDFLIKGSVAVTLFSLFNVDEIVIIAITTIMWVLNFAIPSLLGTYHVLSFSFPNPIKIPVNQK